jgi:probable rRNA maturation factor
MNAVYIKKINVALPLPRSEIKLFASSVLAELKLDGWDLSLVFCNDGYIQKLNNTYRGIDSATDVLSFPCGTEFVEDGTARFSAGDIVISTDTLRRNSAAFNVNETEELRRLIVHGILHLAGRDHATNKSSEPMLREQERLLDNISAIC